jgi:hypothetical protein
MPTLPIDDQRQPPLPSQKQAKNNNNIVKNIKQLKLITNCLLEYKMVKSCCKNSSAFATLLTFNRHSVDQILNPNY